MQDYDICPISLSTHEKIRLYLQLQGYYEYQIRKHTINFYGEIELKLEDI